MSEMNISFFGIKKLELGSCKLKKHENRLKIRVERNIFVKDEDGFRLKPATTIDEITLFLDSDCEIELDSLTKDLFSGQLTLNLEESIRQGRGLKNTLLVDIRASEVGFFDEYGSIYVSDILEVH